MINIKILNNLQIVGYYLIVGFLLTLVIFGMSYALFMRIFALTVFELLNDTSRLLSIYLILILIMLSCSMLASLLISRIRELSLSFKWVLPSAIFSLFLTLILVGLFAYSFLLIEYPLFFLGIEGIEFVLIYLSVLSNFSIFVLNHIFGVIILIVVVYYILFLLLLEFFT